MKKRNQRKPKQRKSKQENSNVKAYIFAVIKTLALLCMLLLLSSFILYKVDADSTYYFPIMLIICGISCFLGGLFTASKLNEKGIICGILGALPIIIFAVAVTVFSGHIGLKFVISLITMLLSGTVGGIITANMRR